MTPAIPAVGGLLFRRTLSSRTGWERGPVSHKQKLEDEDEEGDKEEREARLRRSRRPETVHESRRLPSQLVISHTFKEPSIAKAWLWTETVTSIREEKVANSTQF